MCNTAELLTSFYNILVIWKFLQDFVTSITESEIQKVFLDSKLYFKGHIQNMLHKLSKTIGLLPKLQKILPRPFLIKIYKHFIRPVLDYGDIIYVPQYKRFLSSETGVYLVQRRTSNNRSYNLESGFTINLVLNLLIAEDGIANFVFSIKLSRFSHLGTFSTLLLQPKETILQEMMISYLISK